VFIKVTIVLVVDLTCLSWWLTGCYCRSRTLLLVTQQEFSLIASVA